MVLRTVAEYLYYTDVKEQIEKILPGKDLFENLVTAVSKFFMGESFGMKDLLVNLVESHDHVV